ENTSIFFIKIAIRHPVANGFVLVSKTGSLFTAGGDRVDLAMVGTFKVATLDVQDGGVSSNGTGTRNKLVAGVPKTGGRWADCFRFPQPAEPRVRVRRCIRTGPRPRRRRGPRRVTNTPGNGSRRTGRRRPGTPTP